MRTQVYLRTTRCVCETQMSPIMSMISNTNMSIPVERSSQKNDYVIYVFIIKKIWPMSFKKKKVKCLGQGDSTTRKILSQGI